MGAIIYVAASLSLAPARPRPLSCVSLDSTTELGPGNLFPTADSPIRMSRSPSVSVSTSRAFYFAQVSGMRDKRIDWYMISHAASRVFYSQKSPHTSSLLRRSSTSAGTGPATASTMLFRAYTWRGGERISARQVGQKILSSESLKTATRHASQATWPQSVLRSACQTKTCNADHIDTHTQGTHSSWKHNAQQMSSSILLAIS